MKNMIISSYPNFHLFFFIIQNRTSPSLFFIVEIEPYIGMIDRDDWYPRGMEPTWEFPDDTIKEIEDEKMSKAIATYKGLPLTQDEIEDSIVENLIPEDDDAEEMGTQELIEELRNIYTEAGRPYDYLIKDAMITGKPLYKKKTTELTLEEYDTIRELLKIQLKLMHSGTGYPTKAGHRVDYIDGMGIWVQYDWRIVQDSSAIAYQYNILQRYKRCMVWYVGAEILEIYENMVPYQIETAIRKEIALGNAKKYEIFENLIFYDTIPNEAIEANWDKVVPELEKWYKAQTEIYKRIASEEGYTTTEREELLNRLAIEIEDLIDFEAEEDDEI